MDRDRSSPRLRGWQIVVLIGVGALVIFILVLAAIFSRPSTVLLSIPFTIVFLIAMADVVLEVIGLRRHGDEWVDWRSEPVEPIEGLHDEPPKSPLFRDVANPENFPRRLIMAWKRRVPLKKRNRFFSNRRFPNE